MTKKLKGRLALLGAAAALSVCGCSAGSPAQTEGTDSASLTENLANEINTEADARVYESFAEAGAAMGLELWDFGVNAPVTRSEYEGCEVLQAALGATYEESGTVGTISEVPSEDENPFARELPVEIPGNYIRAGEGGLVPTTVIDSDSDDSAFQNLPGFIAETIEPTMQTVVFSEDAQACGEAVKELTAESAGEFAERDTYQSERLGTEVTVCYGLVSDENVETRIALAVFDEGNCTYLLSFDYDPDTALSDFTERVKEFTEN